MCVVCMVNHEIFTIQFTPGVDLGATGRPLGLPVAPHRLQQPIYISELFTASFIPCDYCPRKYYSHRDHKGRPLVRCCTISQDVHNCVCTVAHTEVYTHKYYSSYHNKKQTCTYIYSEVQNITLPQIIPFDQGCRHNWQLLHLPVSVVVQQKPLHVQQFEVAPVIYEEGHHSLQSQLPAPQDIPQHLQ